MSVFTIIQRRLLAEKFTLSVEIQTRIEFQSTMTISGVIMENLSPAAMFIVQSHLIQKLWFLVHFLT